MSIIRARLLAGGAGVALLAAIVAVLAWSSWSAGHLRLVLSRGQVQQRIAAGFPLHGRHLDLIEYVFADPVAGFDPASGHIRIHLRLALTIAGHALAGEAQASATLRFDAVHRRLELDRVLITGPVIGGLSGALAARLQAPTASALIARLDGLVVGEVALPSARAGELWTIRSISASEQRLQVLVAR